MPDTLGRATVYHELADVSLKLSDCATDHEIRGQYRTVALGYLMKARAELTRAEQKPHRQATTAMRAADQAFRGLTPCPSAPTTLQMRRRPSPLQS